MYSEVHETCGTMVQVQVWGQGVRAWFKSRCGMVQVQVWGQGVRAWFKSRGDGAVYTFLTVVPRACPPNLQTKPTALRRYGATALRQVIYVNQAHGLSPDMATAPSVYCTLHLESDEELHDVKETPGAAVGGTSPLRHHAAPRLPFLRGKSHTRGNRSV